MRNHQLPADPRRGGLDFGQAGRTRHDMTFEPLVANGIAPPAIKVEDAKAVVVGMTERKSHGMCGKH